MRVQWDIVMPLNDGHGKRLEKLYGSHYCQRSIPDTAARSSHQDRPTFSALVKDAHRMGLTEPDPRDDLSGQDVGRKLLILARQMGSQLDIQDVRVDSLVGVDDAAMQRRLERARSRGAVLRYVGVLEGDRARAEMREFPRDYPFAGTKGSDNIIAFTTKRYSRTPLVVQGPGAGADVTAMGVFSDILKLLHYLPK